MDSKKSTEETLEKNKAFFWVGGGEWFKLIRQKIVRDGSVEWGSHPQWIELTKTGLL